MYGSDAKNPGGNWGHIQWRSHIINEYRKCQWRNSHSSCVVCNCLSWTRITKT